MNSEFGEGKLAPRTLAGELVPTISARYLHQWLDVGADFSNWIKRRIQAWGWENGVDFVEESCSPILASKPRHGGHNAVEYHLPAENARLLAVQEHTDRGRECAKQIVNMLKAYRLGELTNIHGERFDMARVGGMMKSVLAAQLREWGPEVIAAEVAAQLPAAIAADPRYGAVTARAANELVVEAGAEKRRRHTLTVKVSYELRELCIKLGKHMWRDRRGVRLFPADVADEFMRARGKLLVQEHNDRVRGQGRLQLVPKKDPT